MNDDNIFGGTTSSGSIYIYGTSVANDTTFTITMYDYNSPMERFKRSLKIGICKISKLMGRFKNG